jgi:hypothetical protein
LASPKRFLFGQSIGALFKIKRKVREIVAWWKAREKVSTEIWILGDVVVPFEESIKVVGSSYDDKMIRQLALLLEDEELDNFDEWYDALRTHDKKKLRKLIEEM